MRNTNRKTKIIGVSSGKGGVGKTMLTLNLASSLSKFGKKVLIFDADLGLANINVLMGLIPKYNLYHVIKKTKELKDIILNTNEGFDLIAGASGYSKLANLDNEQRNSLISAFSKIEKNYDFMIIDTGAGIDLNVTSFLIPADEIVVVITAEPTSITDSYGLIKSIVAQGRDSNIKIVANRIKNLTEGKRITERVINIINQFLQIKVEVLGFIPQDMDIEKSIREQKTFYIHFTKSKVLFHFDAIVKKILTDSNHIQENDLNKSSGLSSFIKKLING